MDEKVGNEAETPSIVGIYRVYGFVHFHGDLFTESFLGSAAMGVVVFVVVFSLLFVILKWYPSLLKFDSGVQSSRMKEVTAELDMVKGQVKYLLGQLVIAENRIRDAESENNVLRNKLAQMERTVAELTKKLEDDETSREFEDVPPLLVVIGSDEDLELDLASLRAVQTNTGMGFRRVTDATIEKLSQRLNRARINGRPYDKIHMSVHSGPEGIYMGKSVVTGEELSEMLKGVNILVISGCESSNIGDLLGVVPYVITISEEVSHSDAAMFARAFWTQIGRNRRPDDALRLALQLSPSGMDEYVEGHW